jgi:hypothetical protein
MFKRTVATALSLCGVLSTATLAQLSVGGSGVMEFTKKSMDSTKTTLDNSIVRGEIKATAKKECGLSGVLHLRMESGLAKTNTAAFTIRQASFTVPAGPVAITGGRWYEYYTPGMYFGRYLFGVSGASSGSMNTNYNVIDGFKAVMGIKAIGGSVELGLLPQLMNAKTSLKSEFEDMDMVALFSASPVKNLSVDVGASFQVITPDTLDAEHRLMLSGGYQVIEDLSVYAEYGITDMAKSADNSWFMAGITIPTAKVLDALRFEAEIKTDRPETKSDETDFAWVLILSKSYKDVTADFNITADPNSKIGSTDAGDIGAILRLTAKF